MATGQTGTFVFATVANALNLIDITPSEESIGEIAAPHLGLAIGAGMPYDPAELVEGGSYELTLEDDSNTQIVHQASGSSGATFKKTIGLKQTCTWTKPLATGMASGATRAFTGFITSVQESQQVTGQRNTIKVKVKVDGTITKTAGAA